MISIHCQLPYCYVRSRFYDLPKTTVGCGLKISVWVRSPWIYICVVPAPSSVNVAAPEKVSLVCQLPR